MRPKTLAEVAEAHLAGDSFDRSLANFLDGFYASPNGEALATFPPLLASTHPQLGKVRDAYLAAVAEELARRHDLKFPLWAEEAERKLQRPWFASPLASLRGLLILESPPGFRSRNLFISANALSRA